MPRSSKNDLRKSQRSSRKLVCYDESMDDGSNRKKDFEVREKTKSEDLNVKQNISDAWDSMVKNCQVDVKKKPNKQLTLKSNKEKDDAHSLVGFSNLPSSLIIKKLDEHGATIVKNVNVVSKATAEANANTIRINKNAVNIHGITAKNSQQVPLPEPEIKMIGINATTKVSSVSPKAEIKKLAIKDLISAAKIRSLSSSLNIQSFDKKSTIDNKTSSESIITNSGKEPSQVLINDGSGIISKTKVQNNYSSGNILKTKVLNNDVSGIISNTKVLNNDFSGMISKTKVLDNDSSGIISKTKVLNNDSSGIISKTKVLNNDVSGIISNTKVLNNDVSGIISKTKVLKNDSSGIISKKHKSVHVKKKAIAKTIQKLNIDVDHKKRIEDRLNQIGSNLQKIKAPEIPNCEESLTPTIVEKKSLPEILSEAVWMEMFLKTEPTARYDNETKMIFCLTCRSLGEDDDGWVSGQFLGKSWLTYPEHKMGSSHQTSSTKYYLQLFNARKL